MALDLLGLGVSMLRCLAGSAVGFMVSKGISSAASESGGSIRTFLQKDIDQIREKLDSLSQSKLSAALQNVRQGLILLDQQFSTITGSSMSYSPSNSDLENVVSLCVTTRAVLATEMINSIPDDVRHQFHIAQQLSLEAFHDKRNVPALLRVECLKLQLFCTMLIHYQQPERWLGLWTVILEESIKDKELASAATSACELNANSSGVGQKSPLAVFWRKPNADLSQAMCHLVENLHCALMAALWHPNVDARMVFGRSRLLQYPRLLLCRPSANKNSQQNSSTITVNLDAPFLYPWRTDRIVVVLPYVYKLTSLYPTNKLLVVEHRNVDSTNTQTANTSFLLKILDTLTLAENDMLQLANHERVLDVNFDRTAFNILVLSSTTNDGIILVSYNLQFQKNSKIKLPFVSPCSQLICDPTSGAVITFEGKSPDDEVYVLKRSKSSKFDTTDLANLDWFSYENIFKCLLTDRPGSIRIAYAKPFRLHFGDDEASFESGLELLLYNRFTDVTYSLVTSFNGDDEMTLSQLDTTVSTTSTISCDDDNMTKIQPVYPLKTPLLKVRVIDDEKATNDHQKVMLEKGAIFEYDELVWAKEKCLASGICDEITKCQDHGKSESILIGAMVSSNETSSLHVFETAIDEKQSNDNTGLRYKIVDELELPLFCDQRGDRFLGGVICFGKFIFIGALSCKVKLNDD